MKFIKGTANVENWNNTHIPPIGHYGACCAELDIWEANSMSQAFTPHPCSSPGLTKCEGKACGDNLKGERYDGMCDKDGCDFNSYRMGDPSFYGPGSDFKVDSSRPFTVVTQFITSDGSDTGDLVEVKRKYFQNGEEIENSRAKLGENSGSSITDSWCEAQKAQFGDLDDFTKKGGLKAMGEALDRGVVLVLSLWDDSEVNMLWLDSAYPTNVSPRIPGVMRGPCPGGVSSEPSTLRRDHPKSHAKYSRIRVGTIGSTLKDDRRLNSEPFV